MCMKSENETVKLVCTMIILLSKQIQSSYLIHTFYFHLTTAFFAFLTMIVHIQHIKGDRDVWVYRLKLFILIGFFTALGCIIAFVVYLVLAIVQKQGQYFQLFL